MSNPKTNGSKKINLELHFTMRANYVLRDLKDREIDYLKQEKLWIEEKRVKKSMLIRLGF